MRLCWDMLCYTIVNIGFQDPHQDLRVLEADHAHFVCIFYFIFRKKTFECHPTNSGCIFVVDEQSSIFSHFCEHTTQVIYCHMYLASSPTSNSVSTCSLISRSCNHRAAKQTSYRSIRASTPPCVRSVSSDARRVRARFGKGRSYLESYVGGMLCHVKTLVMVRLDVSGYQISFPKPKDFGCCTLNKVNVCGPPLT